MDLAEQLKAATARIDELLKAAVDADRALTKEESAEVTELEAKCDDLQAQIEAKRKADALADRQAARTTFLNTPAPRRTTPDNLGNQGQPSGDGIPAVARRANLHGLPDAGTAYASGQWCLAHLMGHAPARRWLDDYGAQHLTMTGSVDSEGGIFIPPEYSMSIIDLQEQYGTARRKCNVIPMGSDTLVVPRRLSGLTAYFVGEDSATTESELAFNQVQLVCRTIATLTRLSKELATDAVIDIAGIVAREIALAFAEKEDRMLFLGDGTSTYGGTVGLITACAAATATVSTAATANTAFSTLDLTDFEEMIGMLPMYPGIRPEWYISQAGWAASMMRLADAAGGNTTTDIEGKRADSFLGYPVNKVQIMNSTLGAQTSTNGLAYFGDLSMGTTLGSRQGIQVEADSSRYFEYRQIAIQGTERVDINVHDVGDTSNAGPVIMLATPSS